MRVQPLQQSYPSRHKLAALLALMTPGLVFADDSANLLRSKIASDAAASNLSVNDGAKKVRTDDRSALVPLPDELIGPLNDGGRLSLAIEEVDGWVPRTGRSALISPLVVDSTAPRSQHFVPAPRLSMGGPRSGESLTASESHASGSAMKIGESGSSTLKIVPNVFSLLQESAELQSETPAEPMVEADSVEPRDRIAMVVKPESTSVDNPEQNEPTGEMTSEEIAAADAIVDSESDGVVPEASDIELVSEVDEMPMEPVSSDELSTDQPIDNEAEAGKSAVDGTATVPAPMEIRRLRLRDDFPSDDASSDAAVKRGEVSRSPAASGDSISLQPLDPSIAKMRVGDVEPRPLSEYETPRSSELVKPLPRAVGSASKNPIHGDTITAEGELILASGQHAARLAVKPQTGRLKPIIERALKYYWDRPEDAAERTHWGMMHSIMVFDRDTQIISRRQRFNAVAWMAGNNPCRNQTLFTQDQHGILPKTGVGLQGHQAQLLAIFGLINVPLNYPVYASKQKFTVSDILQREMRDCKVGTELTFTLIGLAHYADSDTTWISGDGQDWSVPRVIQEELGQPIVGAACGGTHRLMGFGHALRRRHAEGKPLDGQWERADRYVKDFVKYTWSLQNRDGSMSTAWYEKPEDNGDIDRKIQTTGHMLEMLLTVAPDADLQSPEMLRTVNFMATTLFEERGHEWQIGPKGHALRSLAMYYQRVFGSATPWRPGSGSRSAGASNVRTVR